MSLNNLKPALGSNKNSGKGLEEVKVLVKVELQLEVIKGLNQDQDIQERLVLRADKCLYKEGCQNLVLKI